jgi:hypothetical protein
MIATRDLEQFMNQARIKLPGASDMGLKAELYDVLDEFCDESGAWREALTVPILAKTSTNNNLNYQLVPQNDGIIIRLVGVWDPLNIPQPAFMPTNASDDGTEIGQLQLVNPVNQPQNFTVAVIKTVVLPNGKGEVPVFDQVLFRRYHRYLLDGVLGKMMGQLNKSFSNPTLSMYHLRRFENGKAMARVQTERQNTQGAQAWSFPQTFRARGQRGGVSTANPSQF